MHVEAGAKVRPFSSSRDGKKVILSLNVCISNRQLKSWRRPFFFFWWKSLHFKRQREELGTFLQPQLELSATHSPALSDDLHGIHARYPLWEMQKLRPGPWN